MKKIPVPVPTAKTMEKLRHSIRLLWKAQARASSEQPDWQTAVASLGLPPENAEEIVSAAHSRRTARVGEHGAAEPVFLDLKARVERLARRKRAWAAPGRLEAVRYGRQDARRYELDAALGHG